MSDHTQTYVDEAVCKALTEAYEGLSDLGIDLCEDAEEVLRVAVVRAALDGTRIGAQEMQAQAFEQGVALEVELDIEDPEG